MRSRGHQGQSAREPLRTGVSALQSPLRPFSSRALRDLEAFAVFAFEEIVGFGILEALGFGIEVQRTAKAIGDVAQVAMSTGVMGLKRGDWQIGRIPRPHGPEEMLEPATFLRRRRIGRNRDGLPASDAAFFLFVSEKSFAAHVHSLRAEEAVAASARVSFLEGAKVAHLESHDRAVGISEGCGLRIGGLAVVVQPEAAAGAVHPDRQPAIVPPARDVHLVNALVADLTVSVLPEIVPIIMNVEAGLFAVGIDQKRMLDRGSL